MIIYYSWTYFISPWRRHSKELIFVRRSSKNQQIHSKCTLLRWSSMRLWDTAWREKYHILAVCLTGLNCIIRNWNVAPLHQSFFRNDGFRHMNSNRKFVIYWARSNKTTIGNYSSIFTVPWAKATESRTIGRIRENNTTVWKESRKMIRNIDSGVDICAVVIITSLRSHINRNGMDCPKAFKLAVKLRTY